MSPAGKFGGFLRSFIVLVKPATHCGEVRQSRGMARSGQCGFSLIELLAVLLVLSFAATALVVALPRSDGQREFKNLTMLLASGLRHARTTAIVTRQDQRLTINTETRKVSASTDIQVSFIPADVDVEVTTTRGELDASHLANIRFFPDGSSTGGAIRLERNGIAFEVRVNWFTGRVNVVAA